MAENSWCKAKTSEEMMIPLPLSEEGLLGLEEEALTMEKCTDLIRRLYPEMNIVPNVKSTSIPIIPGITLYSYLRFFNAFSFVPAIDIYVNGKKVASDLKYKYFTEYHKAFPGYYRIQIYEAGKTENPLMVTFINLIGYRIYTAAITGTRTDASLELINDCTRPLPKSSALLRFAQLWSKAPVMDVYLDDYPVLSEFDYREVSRYLKRPHGTHNLKFKDYITGQILLEDSDLQLDGGSAYTAYVIGDMHKKAGMEILVKKEGISYLNF